MHREDYNPIDVNIEKNAIENIFNNITFIKKHTQLFKLNLKILMYSKHKVQSKLLLEVIVDLHATTIDFNAKVIKLHIRKHQLTNILVDRRSGINIIANNIHKFLELL